MSLVLLKISLWISLNKLYLGRGSDLSTNFWTQTAIKSTSRLFRKFLFFLNNDCKLFLFLKLFSEIPPAPIFCCPQHILDERGEIWFDHYSQIVNFYSKMDFLSLFYSSLNFQQFLFSSLSRKITFRSTFGGPDVQFLQVVKCDPTSSHQCSLPRFWFPFFVFRMY